MNSNSRVFVRRRLAWLAWYPLRGHRVQFRIDTIERYFEVAFGPVYFCAGPGLPAV